MSPTTSIFRLHGTQNVLNKVNMFNTFKYHVSCTDGKISVRIIYFYYLFFHHHPIQCCVFFPIGLLLLMRHFQQVLWMLSFICLLAWTVDSLSSNQIPAQWCHCRTKWPNVQNKKFWNPTIKIISNLNSNCQLLKPGDRRNFNIHKNSWKCRIDERPTRKKTQHWLGGRWKNR